MRPTRLLMKNFMSYEHTEIDLSCISMAAIVGPIGAGKSTILQAITYALWGEVRTASHDDVVRRGTTSCAVRLDFLKNDNWYTVTRRRILSGKGSSELEFVYHKTDDKVVPLTRNTIRETQEEIDKIVEVSYNVFANSALLQQGEASRFSNAPPSKRKELLGELIGLDDLQDIEGKARARLKIVKTELDQTETLLQETVVELEKLEGIEKKLAKARQDYANVLDDIEEEERDLGRMRVHLAECQQRKRDEQALVDNLASIGEHIDDLAEERKRLDARMITTVKYTDRADQITNAVKQKNRMEAELEDLAEVRDMAATMDKVEALTADAAHLTESIEHYKSQHDDIIDMAQEIESEMDNVNGVIASRKQSIAVFGDRVILAKSQKESLEMGVTCPLCGNLINNRSSLIGRLDSEINKLYAMMEERQEAILIERKIADSLHVETVNLKNEMSRIEMEMAVCADRLSEINDTLDILPEWEHIDYSDGEYEEWEEMLSKLGQADVEFAKLEAAQAEQKSVRARLSVVNEKYNSLVEREREQKLALNKHREEDKDWVWVDEFGVKELETKLRMYRQELDVAKGAVAELEANKKWEVKLRDKKSELKLKMADLSQGRIVLDLLIKASSKTGAQALMIEAALPQIEKTANEYLAHMSPNMRIALESQRVTTTGNIRETLDINMLVDGHSTPIETLSGGERFRADLALRLAIGNMLVSRSNAKIDMLAIDEGFGTQDENGAEVIVDVISELADLFPCVLVITHVPGIADSIGELGNVIRVSKSGGRSTIEIV